MTLAGYVATALVVAAAALFLAALGIHLRARRLEDACNAVPEWPRAFGYEDGTCDWQARVELIERLTIVAQPWSVDALRSATNEERDPRVREAIDAAWQSLR
ncbi:MAG: hypothetical protein JO029_16315 [Candidatus Eremiobacteraeota bacterium]|nr:hypothetical protein [Candidatus Eremiobacteraeota bacterium]MBV8285194.1 hypothetical protein [Candidatus Eremiobacteraeota bacterium]MBV8331400.1 hypothetical protein [Candidatus Eremiobacteraeota bacterium]MBV8435848.1 hypothetical protein [Candidatus Eremiobacteraeota bacterium]MBV8583282.1 hypothetical protein [Candidatus Eremiobacteraeota bacterium]